MLDCLHRVAVWNSFQASHCSCRATVAVVGRSRVTHVVWATVLAWTSCSSAFGQAASCEVIDVASLTSKEFRYLRLKADGSELLAVDATPPADGSLPIYRVPLDLPQGYVPLVSVPGSCGPTGGAVSVSDSGNSVLVSNHRLYITGRGCVPPSGPVGSYVFVGSTGQIVAVPNTTSIPPLRGPDPEHLVAWPYAPNKPYFPHGDPGVISRRATYVVEGGSQAEYPFLLQRPVGQGVFLPWLDTTGPYSGNTIFPDGVSDSGEVYGTRRMSVHLEPTITEVFRWTANAGYTFALVPFEQPLSQEYHFLGSSGDGRRLVFVGDAKEPIIWDRHEAPTTVSDKLRAFCEVVTTGKDLKAGYDAMSGNYGGGGSFGGMSSAWLSEDGTVLAYPNASGKVVHIVLPFGGGSPRPTSVWKSPQTDAWKTSTNWVSNQVPDVNTGIAKFDHNATYTVNINDPTFAAGLQVQRGSVTLLGSGQTSLDLRKVGSECGDFGDAMHVASGALLTVSGLDVGLGRRVQVDGTLHINNGSIVRPIVGRTVPVDVSPAGAVHLLGATYLLADNIDSLGKLHLHDGAQVEARRGMTLKGDSRIGTNSNLTSQAGIEFIDGAPGYTTIVSSGAVVKASTRVSFHGGPTPKLAGLAHLNPGSRLEAAEVLVDGPSGSAIRLDQDVTIVATGKDDARGLVLSGPGFPSGVSGLQFPATGRVNLDIGELHIWPDDVAVPVPEADAIELRIDRPELGFVLNPAYGTPQMSVGAGADSFTRLLVSNGGSINGSNAATSIATGRGSITLVEVKGQGSGILNLGAVKFGNGDTSPFLAMVRADDRGLITMRTLVVDVRVPSDIEVSNAGELRVESERPLPYSLYLKPLSKTTLTVKSGGQLITRGARISSVNEGSPAVVIDAGSKWMDTTGLQISSGSPDTRASVEVANGMLVTGGTSSIGSSGPGRLVLRGAGLRWIADGLVTVGRSDEGEVKSVVELHGGAKLRCGAWMPQGQPKIIISPPRSSANKAIIQVGSNVVPAPGMAIESDADVECATLGFNGDFDDTFRDAEVNFLPGAGIGGVGTYARGFDAAQGAAVLVGDAANAGALAIGGSYTQDATSLIQFGAGLFDTGDGTCLASSRLDVRDLCILGGGVRFVLATESDEASGDGCGRSTPADPAGLIGQAIEIITAQGVAGAFNRVEFGPGFPTNRVQFDYQADKVRVTFMPRCTADFNDDGFLTFEDFDAFIGAFESGDASGDFNADGFITFEDFDAFVGAFEAGC